MEANLTKICYYTYDAKVLSETRISRGLSMSQVADGTGLDRVTVWRVESGRAASYDSVEQICKYLDLDADKVITEIQAKAEARGKKPKKISAAVA